MELNFCLKKSALVLLASGLTLLSVQAQSDPSYRIALFNFRVEGSVDDKLILHCSAANTGRETVRINGKKTDRRLIVEIDSVGLPSLFRGEEALVCQSLQYEYFTLTPGEIRERVVLTPDISNDSLLNRVRLLAYDSEFCPNLVVDTLWVKHRTAKEITLVYSIANTGNAPALLFGQAAVLEDNVALSIYSSSAPAISRGALPAQTSYIQRGKETLSGILPEGRRLFGEISVETGSMLPDFQYFIIQIDPYQSLFECNRTDNTRSLSVLPGQIKK